MSSRRKLVVATAFTLLIFLFGVHDLLNSKSLQSLGIITEPKDLAKTVTGYIDEEVKLPETTKPNYDFDSFWNETLDNCTGPEKVALSEILSKIGIGNSYLNSRHQQSTIPLIPARKILIVSASGRAGSSFLGHLITSFPGTHYIFEPLNILIYYNFSLGIDETMSTTSAEIVKQWLKCSRGNSNSYFKENMKTIFYRQMSIPSNAFFQNKTEVNPRDIDFAEKLCSTHPVRLVKTIWMWLKDTELLLQDEAFNDTRIILLIRDPRALLASWQSVQWCQDNAICLPRMKDLCRKMQNDIESYKRLSRLYPGNFYLMRHEDLSLKVSNEAENLFNFLQLPITTETRTFIDKHTGQDSSGLYETTRNSSQVPYRWLKILNNETIISLEENCRIFMEKTGYPFLQDASTFKYEPLETEKLLTTS